MMNAARYSNYYKLPYYSYRPPWFTARVTPYTFFAISSPC